MKKFLLILTALLIAFVINAQQLVQLSNAKVTTSSSTKVVIKGGITFSGTSSLKDSGIIYIKEDPSAGRENWTDNVSGGVFDGNSAGTVVFNSPNQHQITGNGNFYNAYVRADSGINFLSSSVIRNELHLDTGFVYIPTNGNIQITGSDVNAIQSTSNYGKSYIIGKLIRNADVSGGDYLFPVGKISGNDSLYAPVKLKKTNNALADYQVEYFPATPTDRTNVMSPPIKSISEVEYWTITSNETDKNNTSATITLSWRDYSKVNPLTLLRDSLLIAHYTDYGGVKWITENNYSFLNTVSGNASFGYVTNNSATTTIGADYPYYTLAGQTPLVILPMKLLSFNGSIQNNYSLLQWQTGNNQSAASFELFYSTDNQHFSSIYKTNATDKEGNENYTAKHLQPANGNNYYRLKLTDRLGGIIYSNTINLPYHTETKYKLYPNPADKFINIQLVSGQNSIVRIFDANGKLVAQKNTSSSLLQVDVSALKQGMYYAQIIATGESTTLPFIKR